MQAHYDPWLVVVSIALAMLGAWVSLELLRTRQANTLLPERYRNLPVAVAFATGVWSMHFSGMLAIRLPLELGYDPLLTALSYALVLACAWVALSRVFTTAGQEPRTGFAALLLAGGIGAMHYTGMAAMRMTPPVHYDPWWVAASLAIALAASWGGLEYARMLDTRARRVRRLQLAGALLLGMAVSAMHYTAMVGADFYPGSVSLAATGGLNHALLTPLVTLSAIFLLLTLLLINSDKAWNIWLLLGLIVGGEVVSHNLSTLFPATFYIPGYLLDALLLALFITPVLWQLKLTGRQLDESHRAREQDWRNLTESAPLMIWRCNAQGRLDYANPRLLAFTGRTLEQELLADWRSAIHPQDRDGLESHYQAAWQERKHLEIDYRMRDGSGAWRWLRERAVPLWQAGEFRGFMGLVMDLSDLKQASERTRRHLETQRVVTGLLAIPVSAGSLNALLEQALSQVLSLDWIGLQPQGLIYLKDENARELELAAGQGIDAALRDCCARVPYGDCLCGRVAEDVSPLYAGWGDPRHNRGPSCMKPHGHYVLPIRIEDEMVGVLNLYLPEEHAYDEEELAQLGLVCKALATLIQRHRDQAALRMIHSAFEHTLSGMVITDDKARILRVNRKFIEVTGYT